MPLERFMVYNIIQDTPCLILAPKEKNFIIEAIGGRDLYEKEKPSTPFSYHGGLTGLTRFVSEAIDEGMLNIGDTLPDLLQPEAGLEYADMISLRPGHEEQYIQLLEYFSKLRNMRDSALKIPSGQNPLKYADQLN